ncbi:hypothetical protein L1887_02088 [Cichorium endivia]|nr:hypothetical protein L1887_02088 [Cichorium endivia]
MIDKNSKIEQGVHEGWQEPPSFQIFPLITRSGLLAKLIGDIGLAKEVDYFLTFPLTVPFHLDEIPGGSKTLELILRICYDVKIELTPHNVITLRCASECLEMTDEFGENNLITLTETYLAEVFATWADTMKSLESCEEVLPDAEDLFLVFRCLNSLATKSFHRFWKYKLDFG